jgi:ribosome-binding factor A
VLRNGGGQAEALTAASRQALGLAFDKMAEVKRSTRVAEALREELSSIVTTELSDPRVQGVVISRVVLSDDLHVAKIYIRLMRVNVDAEEQNEALTGLARAAGLLRREVTVRLSLRTAPELRFVYDAGQDARHRVETLLHEIATEKK